MSQDMDTDDGAQTHSRRALLKLSGAAATGLVASSSVGAADSAEFDWEAYEAAVAERYSPGEAAAAVAIIRRHTDGERRLTEAELTVINEQIVQHPDTPAYTADIKAHRANTSRGSSVESTAYGAAYNNSVSIGLTGSATTYDWDPDTTYDYESRTGLGYGYARGGTERHQTLAGAELIGYGRAWAGVVSVPIEEPPGAYTGTIAWDISGYTRGDGTTILRWKPEEWQNGRKKDNDPWRTLARYDTPDSHRNSGEFSFSFDIPSGTTRRIVLEMHSRADGILPCADPSHGTGCIGNQAMFYDPVPTEVRHKIDSDDGAGFDFGPLRVQPA